MSPSGKHDSRSVVRTLDVKTAHRTQLVDVTAAVQRVVTESSVVSGMCHLYVPHTTAGVTINENADPDVPRDIERTLDKLIPKDAGYKHFEGNADSTSSPVWSDVSQSVEIENGRLG